MTALYKIAVTRKATPHGTPSALNLPFTWQWANASVSTSGPVLALGEHGCLIGYLFSRSLPSRRVVALDPQALDRILRTGGRSLKDDYWGAYVLVLRTSQDTVTVFRDPSGMLPCYMQVDDNGARFSSSCPLLLYGQPGGGLVDDLELARFLECLDAVGRHTALRGVEELIAGEACILDASGMRIEPWWSPWDHVTQASNRTERDVAHHLHASVQDCVAAWASCFGSMVLGVSGGLDSSIVATALHAASADLRALTMFGADAQGDERDYASLLTRALDVPLSAVAFDDHAVDVRQAVLPHLPWPIAGQFVQSTMAAHAALDQQRPIDVLFSGNGGDNVFCHVQSASPLIDRLMTEGFGPGAWRTLIDLSELTGSSVWQVARAGLRRWHGRQAGQRLLRDASGLTGTFTQKLAEPAALHPWLEGAPVRLPGKLAHVTLLCRAQKSLEYYARECSPPQISPLLSQPVVELCLSVPSWQWVAGGINRAPARAAFADALPDAILQRHSKGGPTGFMQGVYRANAPAIRSLLSDGLLTSHGILDPAFLAGPDEPTVAGRMRAQRMMVFAAAETWARWWASSRRDPGAHHWRASAAMRAQLS